MTNHTFDKVKIKFEKVLSLIGNILTCEKERNIIQNKLRRHFNTAISDYLCSNEFQSSLDLLHDTFSEHKKSTKYYTLLATFDEQLKKHSIKSIKPIEPSPATTIAILPTASTIRDDVSIVEVQETIEYLLDQCCNILTETLVVEINQSSTTTTTITTVESNSESKHQRKIFRLEKRLNRLSRIIRELEEKEMSLDEMAHCDLYEVESNLKRQACQIHTKLAELKSQSASTERILHQPINLNESEIGHPLINKDLQDMVNQSKNFPCFNDVLDIVEKSNDKYKLNLNEDARNVFAEKSFKIIGKEIKNRRMADFHDVMNSRLPENFNIEQNDPALNNDEMESVLLSNKHEAIVKTEKIFEEYSQIDPDLNTEINIESSENEESTVECEEQEIIIESQPMEFDGVDTLPPIISEPIATESNPIDEKVEISLNDRTLTILSTASLPVRKTIHNRQSEKSHDFQSLPSVSSSTVSKEQQVNTLTPRRKSNFNDNEIIYKLYKQRLTNHQLPVNNKRPITMDYTKVKKSKQQPEVIVLD